MLVQNPHIFYLVDHPLVLFVHTFIIAHFATFTSRGQKRQTLKIILTFIFIFQPFLLQVKMYAVRKQMLKFITKNNNKDC